MKTPFLAGVLAENNAGGSSSVGTSSNPMIMSLSEDSLNRIFAGRTREHLIRLLGNLIFAGITLYALKSSIQAFRDFPGKF